MPFFEDSSGLFLASSGPASSGLFLASSRLFLPLPGFFWPLPVLFWPLFGFFLDSPKSPKFRGPAETSFSVHKTLRFEQFFAKFWIPGLFWPLPGLFWPFPGLFRACLFLASSWPLPGLFLASSGPASSGLFLASSRLFLPLPGFFWPLPVLFWPLFGFFLDSPKSPKFRRFQRRHFLFIKHCVSSSFSPNSGFLAFWGLFVRNPAYPVVFGRCAPAASLRLRLGPAEDNDRRRRCPSPRWMPRRL